MASKAGGGGRKKGRSKRKPSHQRYTLEGRREKNKARRIEKQRRFEERKAAKLERRKRLGKR